MMGEVRPHTNGHKRLCTLERLSPARNVKNLLVVGVGPDRPCQVKSGATYEIWEIHFNYSLWQETIRTRYLDVDALLFDNDPDHRKFRALAGGVSLKDTSRFDRICFADDDLEPEHSWDEVFALAEKTSFEVCQPAIVGHVNHPITAVNRSMKWRETTFVEVMCPILNPRAWRLTIPFLIDRWNWGLEALWPTYFTCGILDGQPVQHVRPPAPYDERPWLEYEAFLSRFGLRKPDEYVLSGVERRSK
jgi:hypothetical protein